MGAAKRLTTLATIGALAVSGALASALPAAAQADGSGTIRLAADSAPRIPKGAVRIGPLAASTRLRLDIVLKLPDPAAVTAFIAAVSNPHSSQFGHYLRHGQFGPRFGPSLATIAVVENALRQAGLSPGAASQDRLAIPVVTSAAAAEHAFGVTLTQYRLPGGRVAFANNKAPSLPSAAAPYVTGVLGLDSIATVQGRPVPPAPGTAGGQRALAGHPVAPAVAAAPRACSAARKEARKYGAFTSNELAQYYLMSPLYGLHDFGKGVRVAVFELEPNLSSDISAFKKCYGLHTTVHYYKVDGGAGSGAGSGEAALDIETIMAAAPDATLDVYRGARVYDESNVYDTYHAIVHADRDQVISSSFGVCELYVGQSWAIDEQPVFEEAATQGQSVLAAAGDTGSPGCLRAGIDESSLSVLDPASQPYVVAVGGTTITNSGEVVWNESALGAGAGGGGVSGIWCMPTYQYQSSIPGLLSSDSETNSGCSAADTGDYVRQVPDVSADADPESGYVIRYKGHWSVIGGTSAATPLWAGIAALIDASPFCKAYASHDPGVLPWGLYALAASDHHYIYSSSPEAFNDVTQGNNAYTPAGYFGDLYPATTGYDMATGLGTPLVSGLAGGQVSMFYPGLAALVCNHFATQDTTISVTGISPSAGPQKGGQKVTVTGTGFMPVAGADYAYVGSAAVKASCSSTTKCTFVTPSGSLGTVDVRMDAEDFGQSPITSADKYQYLPAPTIISVGPGHGSPHGGTKVTILGTNFIAPVTVLFGKRHGTHVVVVSSDQITVTSPAGSGTVTVKVNAAGGTSGGIKFRY
jgi:subtilase family serine protease